MTDVDTTELEQARADVAEAEQRLEAIRDRGLGGQAVNIEQYKLHAARKRLAALTEADDDGPAAA